MDISRFLSPYLNALDIEGEQITTEIFCSNYCFINFLPFRNFDKKKKMIIFLTLFFTTFSIKL